MAKFIIYVAEGKTNDDCKGCPFVSELNGEFFKCCNPNDNLLDCTKYDLSTLKISKQE